MDATKPRKFIGFGAMDATKPYEFIGFGATEATKPYKFMSRREGRRGERANGRADLPRAPASNTLQTGGTRIALFALGMVPNRIDL